MSAAITRVRVEPIRDPGTRRILGWVAQCYGCSAYAITARHGTAMTAGGQHRCGRAWGL